MWTYQLVVVLFAFWVAMTASLHPADLAVGLAVSVLVGAVMGRFLWTREEAPVLSAREFVRLVGYVPYLIFEIARANIYVAEKVLDPELPIDPVIIEHASMLERPVSRVTLANSITLTPGTLTVDVQDGLYYVHCLGREFADAIATRELEHKVARVFEET